MNGLDGVLARLVVLALAAQPRAGTTRVVAVDGRSGAGKTALAGRLAARLEAALVSMEDLYGGWDGLAAGVDRLVSEVLEPLAAGTVASVPRYDWLAGRWGEPRRLPPGGTVVVEGVGCGARRPAAHTSLLVWVQAPAELRRRRALGRGGEDYDRHWDAWTAQEEVLLATERTPDRADAVLTHLPGGALRLDPVRVR